MTDKKFITLDIGSATTKGMVVTPLKEGIEVLSNFSVESEGIRKGAIIDPDKVSQNINKIINHFRQEGIKKIKDVYVNINGYQVFSKITQGAVAISRADQTVSQKDIDRVIEKAKNINVGSNKEILEIFPKEFAVDNDKGIKNPLGLNGIKLEVETLAICVFSPYLKNLIDAVLGANLEIADIIPSPLASAKAVLTPQQKELGAILIDIGAQTTGIAVFEEDTLIHLAVLPIGSSHISNDIAIALKTDIKLAEEIKKKFGRYIFSKSRKTEKITLDKDKYFSFSTKELAKAGQARISEIFDLINKELKKISRQAALPAGAVLTGGGSNLPGIVDFAKKALKLPARKGKIIACPSLEGNHEFSVLCGLALTGVEEQGKTNSNTPEGIYQKIKSLFKTFIP